MKECVLKNIAVLVTRPEHQADNFSRLVENAQGKVIRFPVIAIKEIPIEQKKAEELQAEADALIFISANAVRLGIKALKQISPRLLNGSRIIAIGEATARQLNEMRYPPDLVPPSPYNSEALLALPEMQHVANQRMVVIKGKGGRTYLMEQLRHRGAVVIEIDNYERIKPNTDAKPLNDLMACNRAVIAVTSVKGLHYLFEMADPNQAKWLREEGQFLVPGERVAEAVSDLHIRLTPWVADNATDEVMLEAICKHIF